MLERDRSENTLSEPLLERDEEVDEQPRIIFVNNPEANLAHNYPNNAIKTTKYSWYNFVFLNLYHQFQRIANIYFAVICILQFIPGISPVGGNTIIPLSIVILTTAIKDGYEDFKRARSDNQVNHRTTHVLRGSEFIPTRWTDVAVGDIVKVNGGSPFPADLLCLSSSETQGLCYIETSSLDGETNLKLRRARPETFDIQTAEQAREFRARIVCEQPNNRLSNFEGSMEIHGQRIPLQPENILLRGSILRNTGWIIGTVIFNGHDTKLMKNANAAPHKASQVELMTNSQILYIFALELFMCVLSAVGMAVFLIVYAMPCQRQGSTCMWYFGFEFYGGINLSWESFRGFWTFLILYNNLVPISLYVSMELAKVVQAYLISNDLKMYYEERDIPTVARTSSLNEELGQVRYVFSDKTGTLTRNVMEFLKCSIGGEMYGKGTTEIGRATARREGRPIIDERPPMSSTRNFAFYDERIIDGAWKQQPNANEIREFITLLAVCHTVIPEGNKDNPRAIVYQAASPDEAALVSYARDMGFVFHTRTTDSIIVNVDGIDENYQVLNVLDFNSNRKRMSVIVRDPQGRIMLLCKGADTKIYERLAPNQPLRDVLDNQLESFASEGLRTLVCAKVQLDEEEYRRWNAIHHEAACAHSEREQKLEAAAELIEKNFTLVGATAIEDKLQEGVPETISTLAEAGIRIWVLTGDKRETAINIAFACALLDNDMEILILEGSNFDDLYNLMSSKTEEVSSGESGARISVVVDGSTLELILHNDRLRSAFLEVGIVSKSVVCCRVTPLQKAEVVRLVRENLKVVTLSIGDGANDVSMIQAAHVGIGISGMEGMQASAASDYAIGQFRFLRRLLLVHGRWSYRRISKLILYSFYKNMTLYLTQFWFVLFNGFSGMTLHDKWTIAFYNTSFTFAPIMTLAIFDRDVSDEVCENFPELYKQGHKNKFYNVRAFWGNVMNAFFHSFICFIVPYAAFTESVTQSAGQTESVINISIAVYTAVIFTVTGKCALEISSFTWLTHVAIWGSLLTWFVSITIYGAMFYVIKYDDFYDVFGAYRVFSSLTFWLVVIVTTVIALLRDFSYKYYIRNKKEEVYYALAELEAGGRKVDKEYLLQYFPSEEGIPIKRYSRSSIKQTNALRTTPHAAFATFTSSIESGTRHFLSLIRHRGYAFSQSDNQSEFLEERLGGKRHSDQKPTSSSFSKRK